MASSEREGKMTIMPKSLRVRTAAHCSKTYCQKCGKFVRMRFVVKDSGKYLCSNCKPHKIRVQVKPKDLNTYDK